MITSPGFPKNYPVSSNISWLIEVQTEEFIEVKFVSFESENICGRDKLKMYNGPSDTSPVIGEFCGDVSPPSFISDGSQILLMFQSDRWDNYKGFKLEYKTSKE